jgi:hypothetical protein
VRRAVVTYRTDGQKAPERGPSMVDQAQVIVTQVELLLCYDLLNEQWLLQ